MTPAVAVELEEFCTNCGGWINYLSFNYQSGWCNECTQEYQVGPSCMRCGTAMAHSHRSTCHTCRQELWLIRNADDLEYLVVVKRYPVHRARQAVIAMIRPVCRCCGKPIIGAREGSLFCKQDRRCHRAYNKLKRLQKTGLTIEQALARIKELYPREVDGNSTGFRAVDQ